MNPKPERIDAAYALVGGGIAVIEEKLVYLDKQTPPTDSAIETAHTQWVSDRTTETNNKTSGRDKLVALGLTTAELDALGIK